ncbi:MAG: adenylate/guanylate cyclase domain-containing protein, partial [Pseudomonadota bacterium]
MRRTIAATYLGKVAGNRVLSGEIARGEGKHIDAVIWYCDLRGSAELCDTLGVDEYLPLLNKYFVATAGPVMREGGDVLDFIGDAVLAIFPLHEDGAHRALRATEAAAREVDALRLSEPAFQDRKCLADVTGIAIATGSVVYGNIGVPQRLTFSVIGPTVNAVARLEDLTKVIGEPILATENVARHLGADMPFRALGAYRLPGQREAQQIYAPELSAP